LHRRESGFIQEALSNANVFSELKGLNYLNSFNWGAKSSLAASQLFTQAKQQLGPPEKVCGGQTDNELIPNQTETYGSSWGDLNI
jgi:hypothetical protein